MSGTNIQYKILRVSAAWVLLITWQLGHSFAATTSYSLNLPARPADAPSGRAVLEKLLQLSPEQRQDHLVSEIRSGNVPDSIRKFKKVSWTTGSEHTSQAVEVSIWGLPDYLGVGSEDDFLRVPLTPQSAQYIADLTGTLLPTPLVVDRIYASAEVKLEPAPFSPQVYDISAPSTWHLSQTTVSQQMLKGNARMGQLIAGHKKDVVITRRLSEPDKNDNVAIYGWHKLDGKPIQPLSLVHGQHYVDYSHGIRLVLNLAEINGITVILEDALADPLTSHYFSAEGPLTSGTLRYPDANRN